MTSTAAPNLDSYAAAVATGQLTAWLDANPCPPAASPADEQLEPREARERPAAGVKHWTTLLAIDADKWAAATYAANFPGVRVECGPVADYLDSLPAAAVIIGGPPCQPFSTAGKGKGNADARDCIPDFLDAVERVWPRHFLMENVPDLLNDRHAAYRGRFWGRMESLGYRVEARELDAVNYGVPQFRRRVWFWGIRSDVAARHEWPKPTHAWPPPDACMFGGALLPGVTVGAALGLDGYVRRVRGAGVIRRDHPTTEPSPTIYNLGATGTGLKFIGDCDEEETTSGAMLEMQTEAAAEQLGPRGDIEGDGGRHSVRGVRADKVPAADGPVIPYRYSDKMLAKHPPASPAPTVMGKWLIGGAEGLLRIDGATGYNGQRVLEDAVPCPTIPSRGNPELVFDPASISRLRCQGIRVRRLSPQECLRLQSGPDDFRWPAGITKTAMYRVVGNGVACGMGWHITQAMAKADPTSRTVVSLFCGGGLLDCGMHGRYWRYTPADAGQGAA